MWDESFLWGLMSYKALLSNGLGFDLLRSEDIRNGGLRGYSMLFVPGGWASNKIKSLGEQGTSEIKKFVRDGGAYLGFCGGAGLATMDGIGLLGVKRKPTKERVPSFSGKIRLNLGNHEIWKNLATQSGDDRRANIFHAWWPSQFMVQSGEIEVIATYAEAVPDSFSSDLNVADTSALGRWGEMEGTYGINLDPERLRGDPAVLEGRYGKGRVMLSLIHFDTPEDRSGAIVLGNLWRYLEGEEPRKHLGRTRLPVSGGADQGRNDKLKVDRSLSDDRFSSFVNAIAELESEAEELIALGSRNFLWFWRNPMLLQWRRGVRGLEYCTLYILIREIAALVCRGEVFSEDHPFKGQLEQDLNSLTSNFKRFAGKAMRLLVLERLAMQNARITYDKCEDPEIAGLRAELFSSTKSHGGLFKEVIDEIDRILFALIRLNR